MSSSTTFTSHSQAFEWGLATSWARSYLSMKYLTPVDMLEEDMLSLLLLGCDCRCWVVGCRKSGFVNRQS